MDVPTGLWSYLSFGVQDTLPGAGAPPIQAGRHYDARLAKPRAARYDARRRPPCSPAEEPAP